MANGSAQNGTARLRAWVEWFIRWAVAVSVPVLLAWGIRTEVRMQQFEDFRNAGPRVTPVHLEASIAAHERAMRQEFIGREALDERFARLEALLQPMQRDIERIRADVDSLKRRGN